ncbi:MAG: right-handed parallel beta-helix repeat-containing protein [Candidatus Altiarchaeota archaeon]
MFSNFTESIALGASQHCVLQNISASNNELFGVHIMGGSHNNTLQSITADNNAWGISIASSDNITLHDSIARNNSYDGFITGGEFSLFVNNTAINNSEYGFRIQSNNNNQFIGNTGEGNGIAGYYLTYGGNNTFQENHARQNIRGIFLLRSSNNSFFNNIANNNTQFGIYLDSSDSNTLTNNNASNNSDGIYLSSSSNNTLINNTGDDNIMYGIYIYSSSNNNSLTDNTVSNNGWHGIGIRSSSNNTLINNTADNNDGYGIHIYLSSNYNILEGNSASNNNEAGIHLESSSKNTLTGNTANYNLEYGGIWLYSSSNYNTLTNNTADNNIEDGIWLHISSNYNTLTGNRVSYNSESGIYIESSSNNDLTGNNASNNDNFGIYIDSNGNDNTLFSNDFCDNDQGIGANFDIYDLDSNSGDNNTCDTTYQWNDDGEFSGCTYPCPTTTSTTSTSTTSTSTTSTINPPPTHDTPLILPVNSTSDDDLVCMNQSTADPEGENVTNVYNWLVNQESLTHVNFPFDSNDGSTTRDYSGSNNNGTVMGATWTENGLVGGAYEFDGLNDYIILNSILPSTNEGTIEAWFKFDEHIGGYYDYCIIGNYDGGAFTEGEYLLYINNDNDLEAYLGHGTGQGFVETPFTAEDVWTHVVLTFEPDNVVLYVNGSAVASDDSFNSTTVFNHTGKLTCIGRDNDGPANSPYRYFNGTIDMVRIYKRPLTSNQVYQLFLETKDNYFNQSKIMSNETMIGDVWTCQVTPNDGTSDGTTKTAQKDLCPAGFECNRIFTGWNLVSLSLIP